MTQPITAHEVNNVQKHVSKVVQVGENSRMRHLPHSDCDYARISNAGKKLDYSFHHERS